MKAKLIAILLAIILILQAIIPNFIYATDLEFDINPQTYNDVKESYTLKSFDKLRNEGKATINSEEGGSKTKNLSGTFSLGSAIGTAVAGLFCAPAMIASGIMTIAARGQNAINGTTINWYTIEDTVYNKIELFDANYFIVEPNDVGFNKSIKNAVAIFYYITRIIAVLMGLLMFIYLGIRIALSTIASDIAKYKQMLIDWFVSMLLIFVTPYIVGAINLVASSLVNLFASMAPKTFEQSLILQVFNLVESTHGWAYVAIVCMYLIMTFYQLKFFLMYIYRMLSMGFLIIISPLITITYSATKTPIQGRGGKAPMFERWFKEYMVNAFIQPLHAALYMVFMITAAEIFTIAPFLTVIFFMSLSRAERIFKNIFGMRKMSSIHSMSAYVPFPKE